MKNILPRLSLTLITALTTAATAQTGASQLEDARSPAAKKPSPYAVRPVDRVASRTKESKYAAAIDKLPPGDRLLWQAINQLERRESVTARMRYQVRLGKHLSSGAGKYWQHGSGDALRLRMELELLGQNTRLLQVSNSRFLWIDEQLPTGRKVARIDLRQLRADPSMVAASSSYNVQPGEASWSPLAPELSAHSGGLPSLLASLQENFTFLPPQAMRLALDETADGKSPTIPVFAVVGHWRAERLANLVKLPEADEHRDEAETAATSTGPADKRARVLRALPPRMPQEVLLLVGQADSFPYWIEYRRLETPLGANQNVGAIPYQLSAAPMVVLELSQVLFDKKIPTGRFDYSPGEVDWVDQTAQRLERLRR